MWQAKRLGEHGQDQALPLIAGMDFEDAVFFEGKRVDRLELVVHHAAGRIGSLERGARASEGGIEPLVVHQQHAVFPIRDLRCAMVENIPFGNICSIARRPFDLDKVGSADGGRIRAREYHHPARNRIGGVLERETADITLDLPGGRIIDRAHLRAVARRRNFWPRIDHALDARVDPVPRAAVCLRRNVKLGGIAPNQAALRGGLYGHLRQFVCSEDARQIATTDDFRI